MRRSTRALGASGGLGYEGALKVGCRVELDDHRSSDDWGRGSAEDGQPLVSNASGTVPGVAMRMSVAVLAIPRVGVGLVYVRQPMRVVAMIVTGCLMAVRAFVGIMCMMGGSPMVVVAEEIVKANVDARSELEAEEPNEQDDECPSAQSSCCCSFHVGVIAQTRGPFQFDSSAAALGPRRWAKSIPRQDHLRSQGCELTGIGTSKSAVQEEWTANEGEVDEIVVALGPGDVGPIVKVDHEGRIVALRSIATPTYDELAIVPGGSDANSESENQG